MTEHTRGDWMSPLERRLRDERDAARQALDDVVREREGTTAGWFLILDGNELPDFCLEWASSPARALEQRRASDSYWEDNARYVCKVEVALDPDDLPPEPPT